MTDIEDVSTLVIATISSRKSGRAYQAASVVHWIDRQISFAPQALRAVPAEASKELQSMVRVMQYTPLPREAHPRQPLWRAIGPFLPLLRVQQSVVPSSSI